MSLKVIRIDMDQSATYDFLLTLQSSHEPISYHFLDKQQFQSIITNFPTPWGSRWNWVPMQWVKKLEWWGYQMVKTVLR